MSRNTRFNKKADPTKFMPKKVKQEFNQEKRIQKVETKVTKINRAIELKYKDVAITPVATVTGALTLLNGVAQGINQSQRIGAQLMMKSLQYSISFKSLTTIVVPTELRFMLVLDRQANTADPAIGGSPGASAPAILNTLTITDLVVSPRQFETIKRFKILIDKVYTLNPNMTIQTNSAAATSTIAVEKHISGFIKLGQVVKNDDSSDTIAGIVTNSLYFIAITDIPNGVQMNGGSRLYFTDP